MSTTIRAEISKKGKWYISKHRFYELKHFCLQYDEWKDAVDGLTSLSSPSGDISTGGTFTGDRTGNTAVKRASMRARMEMIEPVSYTHLTLPTICSV